MTEESEKIEVEESASEEPVAVTEESEAIVEEPAAEEPVETAEQDSQPTEDAAEASEPKEESSTVVTSSKSVDKAGAMAAIKAMFSFFTILPIDINKEEMDSMNRNFWLVPIIGLFYGCLAVLVFLICDQIFPAIVSVSLTIFAVEAVNRFLHFDGLIDFGDGLMVAGTREDHVRALKDTLVGAGGVATAVMMSLLLFSEILSLNWGCIAICLVGAEVLARFAQTVTACYGIASNGMAGDSVRNMDTEGMLKALVVAVFCIAIGFVVMSLLTFARIDAWPEYHVYISVALAMVVVFGWGVLMAKVSNKNFGFVNGDVLGATNQTARIVSLLVMILVITNWVW